ncbi:MULTISPECIES: VOC family protein [Dermacoccus]|uniref:VOC domain-containing protein n=2 Tax=Micrococcales TaxID=85006 RepID=A0ABN2D786_9MICO|nr:VOC family protein [Dermacoccus abyssi]
MSAEPSLVPELAVTDCDVSVRFWRDLLAFEVLYDRPEEGFAYLALGDAHLMLDQADIGRTWRTAPFDPPLGRGINFQISVPDVADQLKQLREANWPLFMEPEDKWYRIGPNEEAGVRQFLTGVIVEDHRQPGPRGLPVGADDEQVQHRVVPDSRAGHASVPSPQRGYLAFVNPRNIVHRRFQVRHRAGRPVRDGIAGGAGAGAGAVA